MATTDSRAMASADPIVKGLGRRSFRHSPPEPSKGCTVLRCSPDHAWARRVEVGNRQEGYRVDDSFVTVMMSNPERTKSEAAEHRLRYVEFISDPGQKLYEVLRVGRGSFSQLFGIIVWLQSVLVLLKTGGLVGKLEGNGLQMPGFILLESREVIKSYKYRTAAHRIDFADFASCPNLNSELVTVQR